MESKPLIIFLGILVAVMVWHALGTYWLRHLAQKEQAELEAAIAGKRDEIGELREKLNEIEVGEGLEIEAKKRLNLQKPGEGVIIIVEEGSKEVATSSQSGRQRLWNNILHWFGLRD